MWFPLKKCRRCGYIPGKGNLSLEWKFLYLMQWSKFYLTDIIISDTRKRINNKLKNEWKYETRTFLPRFKWWNNYCKQREVILEFILKVCFLSLKVNLRTGFTFSGSESVSFEKETPRNFKKSLVRSYYEFIGLNKVSINKNFALIRPVND